MDKVKEYKTKKTTGVHIDFARHGLGDCALFAHTIPLYLNRFHEVSVNVGPDKACLFEAAGARVAKGGRWHEYAHWTGEVTPSLYAPWTGNKVAWSLGRAPMPGIATTAELWTELLSVELNLEDLCAKHKGYPYQVADEILAGLPRPVILFHPQGTNGPELKNLNHQEQHEFLLSILDNTGGSVLILDWHNRTAKLQSFRVRHLLDDYRALGVPELYALLQRADLFVGVDSGPLHLLRFTKTLGLGVWNGFVPAHFALPRRRTAHLVPETQTAWTRTTRIPFNLIESPGDRPTGEDVAKVAAGLLGDRAYLNDPVRDVVLGGMVRRLRHLDLPAYHNRQETVGRLLRELRHVERPLVLETGTMRAAEDYGAGMFAYVCGLFLRDHGGRLVSVDLDPENVQTARDWTRGLPVDVTLAHSHDYLNQYSGPPFDAVLLDSQDTWTEGFESNCLEEARLVLPHLKAGGWLLLDDTYWEAGKLRGKGEFAVPFLKEQGLKIIAAGYQVLMRKS